MIDALSFGKHFGLTKTVADSGSGSRLYHYSPGDGPDYYAVLDYSCSFWMNYIDTPNGPLVYEQFASFTITNWNGHPGEDSATLPGIWFKGADFWNYKDNKIIQSSYMPACAQPFAGPPSSIGVTYYWGSYEPILLPNGPILGRGMFTMVQDNQTNGQNQQSVSVSFWNLK